MNNSQYPIIQTVKDLAGQNGLALSDLELLIYTGFPEIESLEPPPSLNNKLHNDSAFKNCLELDENDNLLIETKISLSTQGRSLVESVRRELRDKYVGNISTEEYVKQLFGLSVSDFNTLRHFRATANCNKDVLNNNPSMLQKFKDAGYIVEVSDEGDDGNFEIVDVQDILLIVSILRMLFSENSL